MNLNIKPVILTASDYHIFRTFCDNVERLTGFEFDYEEVEPARISPEDFYRAIIWPVGAEEELFEFIFTNQEAWEILTEEE
jgi:hypothetical protein